MDDDERPRRRSTEGDFGAASLLTSESLERYSLDELDARIALLEDEIARIKAHRDKSSAHMTAAQALFRPKQP
ncbi:uncharacterized small protein (DUF1192 family) [Novosphingobium fluoreni]|uniref:Uncharacterized small protein (DUF1192 family) n=1 Tax=Novosphingobium fluoreni TaxID=1391222 RepID=A0A7W6FX77_9SPHN|nr:DUF1192 domain-containing protein [Novosphingobium fluoreni]KTR82754.1 hypothetical protein NS277_12395 [Novosphingobium barchaimii]MBB3938973.1 uncharacterized small protein (DUF1192 family) [Novosphingobium fluoreni]